MASVQTAYDEGRDHRVRMRRLEADYVAGAGYAVEKHLQAMDHYVRFIRAYANKNPKQEYKRESFAHSRACYSALSMRWCDS